MSVSPDIPLHATSAMPTNVASADTVSHQGLPIYVDLDGTLTYSDLLFESFLLLIKRNPFYLFACFAWLLRGRGFLKAQIAQRVTLDVSLLPYNQSLLTWLREQRQAGRRLVLASASNKVLVQQVGAHLELFDAVIASDAHNNLKSHAKLQAIQADAGGKGFAYCGNDTPDLAVWAQAGEIVVVNASPSVLRRAEALRTPTLVIDPHPVPLLLTFKALRLHQWAKNVLIFVPLLAAHELDAQRWLITLVAFVAFGMCASATYVINDLFDLASDRAHPRKNKRPFASARLSIPFGMGLVCVLLPLSLLLALWIALPFFLLMLLYVAVTLLYSARLKQIAIVDVLVLASLYTHRILAGGEVSDVVISNWLLAVSLFMFLSLALVKRCAELEFMNEDGRTSAAGRGYRTSDLSYLISMGIASGFVAVMLLALYIDRQDNGRLYPHSDILWLILPLMLFWIMRLWLKISRMEIHDDPLLFAITDRASWVVGFLAAAVALAASIGGWK
ncbi:UbiA family prenyltransferase [uncultured Oxalicibacterium sp.]|uniref:UbiA family prenyltransferase n=1 Tax=uncultured Oxalicibacterium sp. TaxID=1168540 RepID=UPI0025DB0742|nr:UbiA family prenyltransferase [uncultured Oxalicibacterium sp.]